MGVSRASAGLNALPPRKTQQGVHAPTDGWTPVNSLDLAVLGLYAAVLLAVGLGTARGHQTSQDLTLGGHRLPVWAVLLSMTATELSAATFIGVPQASFAGNWSYLQLAVGALLAKIWVARAVIPRYHAERLVTVYGFLTQRYGQKAGRAASLSFIGGRVLASGARLFIAALAFSLVANVSINSAIIIAGALAAGYTLAGGIRSVVYTDVLQGAVFLTAALGLLVTIAVLAPGGLWEVWNWGQDTSRTQIFQLSPFFSISRSDALGTALIGAFFLTLATHSTDHDMVQRLLTTRDGASGGRALLGSAWINFPLTFLFLAIGTGIAFVYSGQSAHPHADSSQIVALFAWHELPSGVRGLVFAGLFAAAMSSLDSAICAIGTTWVTDVWPGPQSADHALHASSLRWASAVFSGILILSALLMAAYHDHLSRTPNAPNLVEFALGTMSILYGGLLGVFGVAFLTRSRGSEHSALAGLAIGTLAGMLLFLHPVVMGQTHIAWTWWIPLSGSLAFAVTASRPSSGVSGLGSGDPAAYPSQPSLPDRTPTGAST